MRRRILVAVLLAGNVASLCCAQVAPEKLSSMGIEDLLNTGLTWQAGETLSFSVFGQNLLQNERLEYVDVLGSTASTLVKRGAYAKAKWIF